MSRNNYDNLDSDLKNDLQNRRYDKVADFIKTASIADAIAIIQLADSNGILEELKEELEKRKIPFIPMEDIQYIKDHPTTTQEMINKENNFKDLDINNPNHHHALLIRSVLTGSEHILDALLNKAHFNSDHLKEAHEIAKSAGNSKIKDLLNHKMSSLDKEKPLKLFKHIRDDSTQHTR
jgi:inner membrane protein involved in colicin E2 resistance